MTVAPELLPELEPEIEVTARAAPRVGLIALLAVLLGMCLAADAICRAFFGTIDGTVGWIPVVGKLVEKPIHYIENKLLSFLKGLETHIDNSLAYNIHVTAKLIVKLLRSIEYLAVTCVLLGALAAGATATYVIGPLKRWVHQQIARLEALFHHIATKVTVLEEVVKKTYVHNVYKHIKNITVAVPKYIHRELLTIRHEAKTALRLSHIAIRKAESSLVPKDAKNWPDAVREALPALGLLIPKLALDAIKCTNFQKLFNNRGCNLWSDLEDILGLLADVLIFDAMCHVLPLLNKAFGDIATPFVRALVTATKELCPGPPASWTEFAVKPNEDRPAQTVGPTPS